MRQIGFIDEEPDAQRFGDYLFTQGIRNSIEQMQGGAWAVWVEDDDLLERGRAELEQFRANPTDPKYQAAGRATKIRKQEKKQQGRRRTQYIDVRTRWGQPSQFARPVTIALAAISIVIAVGTKLGESSGPMADALYIAPWHPSPDDPNYGHWGTLWEGLSKGQVWRLITPIFLHSGVLHILFNMLWLVDLGSMVETRRGSWYLLLLVIVTAAISNTAEYYLPDPTRPNAGFGGMSGVNYALLGYAWIKGRYQPDLGIGVSQQIMLFMMIWLFLCMTGLVGRIANVAHVGGLLSGAAIAYVPYAVSRLRRGR